MVQQHQHQHQRLGGAACFWSGIGASNSASVSQLARTVEQWSIGKCSSAAATHLEQLAAGGEVGWAG